MEKVEQYFNNILAP